MRCGRWMCAVILLLCGWLAAQMSGPLLAEQNDASDKRDSQESVEVRYARAYLKAIEAQLFELQETNRLMAASVRPSVMESVEANVREAKSRVDLLLKKESATDADVYIAAAETALKIKEESLRRAEQANRTFAGSVRADEVAHLQAEVDLAKARIELTRPLASASPEAVLRYAVEQLREDVEELKMYVAILRDRN